RSTFVPRSGVVDGRAYERVPEDDRARMDADKPSLFRRFERGEVAYRRRIGGCGGEQCATRLCGKAAKRAPHGALHALGSGQVIRKRLAPDAFCLAEERSHLEQGERVPTRRPSEVAGDVRGDRRAETLVKKLHGRCYFERIELDRGKCDAEVGAFAFAHGKQERERLGREPPRSEGERFGRRAVEPV